jgi:hypothetical protein
MAFQIVQTPSYSPGYPFKISSWTGENTNGDLYYVEMGNVMSTFSWDTGTFIQVKNVGNKAFKFENNFKFYIDFTVLPNLQVSGAELKCERVGSENPMSIKDLYPNAWPSYPNMVHTEPKDEYNSDGSIKILRNGKRQGKCYALIGYRSDDEEQNGRSYGGTVSSNTTGGFIPVQIWQSDIMMVNVAINGVPCVVPMPYNGATQHYKAVSNDY